MWKKIKTSVKLFYFNQLTKNLRKLYVSSDQRKKKVIFYSLRTIPTYSLLYFESIIAHVLNMKGAEASLLVCDNALENCDAGTIGEDQALIAGSASSIAVKNYSVFKFIRLEL